MNQVFSKILQQEKLLNRTFQDESRILINALVTRNRGYGRRKGPNARKICMHYGKVGHTIDVCYKKHGFPPNFMFRNRSTANNVFQEDIGKLKHSEDDATPKVECSKDSNVGLTQKQYQNLVALLKQTNLQVSTPPGQIFASQISTPQITSLGNNPSFDLGNTFSLLCHNSVSSHPLTRGY